MAPVLEQLLSVQELDTTIDQLQHRRNRLPERDELAALSEAESALAQRRAEIDEQVATLARSQKRLEDEIALVQEKRAEVDKRLYSGTITAPRELQAMQDDIASLDRRTSELEDDLLEVLTETEPVDEAAANADREGVELSDKRRDVESRLAAAEAEIDAELAQAQAARADAASDVPEVHLAEYERRRPQLGGIAVARLMGTSCGGCHLALSAVEIARIRKLAPDEPATCEECGRMLVR